MFRIILYSIILTLLVRALLRFWGGVVQGMGRPGGAGAPHAPQHGVHMVRDPICGTFVLPAEALSVVEGRTRVYFCSATCRDRYHKLQGQTA